MATHGLALTAEVAARGKLSAVRARFYSDPYVACFLPSLPCPCPSLGAMINTGQYARVAAIGSVIEQFMRLAPPQSAQIVSLGAGLDTRFWQLHDSALLPARYIELDQPCVVEAKARAIASSPQLLAALPGGAACCSESGVASVCYSCIGVDLCDLSKLDDALQSAQWDKSAPTLVIAECLLVEPHDPFGQMMVRNLFERGCPLLSIHACPTVSAQKQRAEATGWSHAETMDMYSWFETVFTSEERRRIRSLELLDELEEFQLLLRHYCVLLAIKDDQDAPVFSSMKLSIPLSRPPLEAAMEAALCRNRTTEDGTGDHASALCGPSHVIPCIDEEDEEEH
ncbi:MAG: hypothetical protein SGPRY_002425 [Prymnesium sp.]